MDTSSLTVVAGLAVALRWILGATLLLSGVGKLRNPVAFVAGVLQYDVLPPPLARWYGRLLPLVEVGTGVLLLAGLWLRAAIVLSLLLFLSFSIAVGMNLWRKRDISCFCFGTHASEKISWQTLARIALLLMYRSSSCSRR